MKQIDLEEFDYTREISGVCNYYGSIWIGSKDEKYYWSIENHNGFWWQEIPKSLFDEIKTFQDGQDASGTGSGFFITLKD